MTKHTLSVLVENKPGVLARIAGLFSRRGFNIESLAVGPTEHPEISRMTIVVDTDERLLSRFDCPESSAAFVAAAGRAAQEVRERVERHRCAEQGQRDVQHRHPHQAAARVRPHLELFRASRHYGSFITSPSDRTLPSFMPFAAYSCSR